MGKTYFVYVHIAPNNKKYYGITCRKPENRWGKDGIGYANKHKRKNSKHQSLFYNAILKYGWNNFEHRIVAHGLTEEQAKRLEIKLISFF